MLDVGANDGTYARDLRRGGYGGRICSYEPLHEAFAQLSRAAAGDDFWKTVNCACGAKAAVRQINVSKNSYSASLLPTLEAHTASAPGLAYIAGETISLCTLDDSMTAPLSAQDNLWLKIDTQGYEAEVLKGAMRLLPHVRAMECELSLTPLYDGQPLIDEMIPMIYQMGFRMVSVAPMFFEPNTGHALQVDGVFLRL